MVIFEDDSIRGRLEWMAQEVQEINEFTISLVAQVRSKVEMDLSLPVSLRKLQRCDS